MRFRVENENTVALLFGLLVLVFFTGLQGLWVVFVFTFVVGWHELFHLLAAKAVGLRPSEFSIGLGPKAFGYQGQDTFYSLRIIPLGGFVLPIKPDSDDEPSLLLPGVELWKQAVVVAAGPIGSIILALALMIPTNTAQPQATLDPYIRIAYLAPGAPAEIAGLRVGDQLVAVDDVELESFIDLRVIISRGDSVRLSVLRDTGTFEVDVKPSLTDGAYRIGFQPEVRDSTSGDVVRFVFELPLFTIKALVGLVFDPPLNISGAPVSGPVGIFQHTGSSYDGGVSSAIYFMGYLSAAIGWMNLVFFIAPVTDGGRLVFIAYCSVFGEPRKGVQTLFSLIGFLPLVALILYSLTADIVRLF